MLFNKYLYIGDPASRTLIRLRVFFLNFCLILRNYSISCCFTQISCVNYVADLLVNCYMLSSVFNYSSW